MLQQSFLFLLPRGHQVTAAHSISDATWTPCDSREFYFRCHVDTMWLQPILFPLPRGHHVTAAHSTVFPLPHGHHVTAENSISAVTWTPCDRRTFYFRFKVASVLPQSILYSLWPPCYSREFYFRYHVDTMWQQKILFPFESGLRVTAEHSLFIMATMLQQRILFPLPLGHHVTAENSISAATWTPCDWSPFYVFPHPRCHHVREPNLLEVSHPTLRNLLESHDVWRIKKKYKLWD
jgi:hypothetical protein